MKTNGDDSAFAREEKWQGSFQLAKGSVGLTKREYFAALAMQGLIVGKRVLNTKTDISDLGNESVMLANALIEALNKEQE